MQDKELWKLDAKRVASPNYISMSTKRFSWQESQPGRRAGLSASHYRNQSLLSIVGAKDVSKQKIMPPNKVKTKVKDLIGEDEASLLAPPVDTDSDSQPESNCANIKSTSFKSKLIENTDSPPSRQPLGKNSGSRRSTRALANKNFGSTSRSSQPISRQGINSQKRKNEDDDKIFGAAIKKRTAFDGSSTKMTKVKTKYGGVTKAQRSTSSKSSQESVKAQPKFIQHDTSLSSDEEDQLTPSNLKLKKRFKPISTPDSSPEKPSESIVKKKFIIHEMSDIEDSPMEDTEFNKSRFKAPSIPNSPSDCKKSSSRPRGKDSDPNKESSSPDPPEERLDIFQKLKLKFPDSIDDMLSEDALGARTQSPIEEDDVLAPNLSRCPMCNKPVSKQLLESQGFMNIRQQERFCNKHQRDSAFHEWDDKGYPEINWNSLDSRIAQHHEFIQKLIKGQDSHYRQLLDDIVEAGTERNLLKSKGNLTPGYYGSRGLRAISENIMLRFTPLLKERAIQDKAVMARGVTAFVQMVLVPEVATLLIMEDMEVDEEKARDVLVESIGLGDMIHEEIQDVVVRKDEDESDQEDSDGDIDDLA